MVELRGALPHLPVRCDRREDLCKAVGALAAQDIVVGSHDLIIAATSLSMDYVIITANIRDFGKIEGLKVEKF